MRKPLFVSAIVCAALACPAPAQDKVEYRVDPAQVVGKVDVGVHGQFLEHIFNSVHGGLWGDLVLNPSLESASRGEWTVKDGVIGTTRPVTDRRLIFGDPKWGDYELTLEARRLEGGEGFIIIFRAADRGRFYWANMGGWGNKQHAIEKSRRPMQPMVDGQVEKGRWYRVRIRCEGPKIGVWLNDKQVIDQTDDKDPILRGAVGLNAWNTRVEFRNIKVASLDGKTLFEGLPPATALAQAPAYWSFFGDAQYSFPGDQAFNSGTSLRMRRGSDRGEGGIRQGPIPLKNGERYRGSLWARGQDGAALQVRLVDAQGQVLHKQEIGEPGGEWKKHPIEFTASRAVGEAVLEIAMNSAGQADVDMVSLFPQAALDAGGFRPDVLKVVADLKPASIRYPGGCFASAYRWKDGVGPREKRTYFPNVIWDDRDPSQMGTDEFLDLCRRARSEPIIVININQSVEEALDWLEYCNGPADSKWGSERARNGHPEPYNVTLWEIDNETWGMGPERYADAVIKFGRALRKKDPSIKILACGGYGYDDGKGSTNGWNKRLLDKAAKDFDYLSIHYYNGIRYAQDHVDDPRRYEAYMRDDIGKLIRESANPAVRIYCSEWGMMNDQWRSGLYAGSILNAFERISELCPMACTAVWLQTVTRERPRPRWASCSILFDHQTCYGAPAYVVQKLWRDHFAPKRIKLDGPERPLDVIATLSEDGKTLYLKGVNSTGQAKDLAVTIADGFKPAQASMLLVAGQLDDRNTLDEPNKLAPRPGEVKLDGQVVRFILPAHSAGAVRILARQ